MQIYAGVKEIQVGEFPLNVVIEDKGSSSRLIHFSQLKEQGIKYKLFRDKISGIVFMSLNLDEFPYESEWEVLYSG
jgi:hypothetical protein